MTATLRPSPARASLQRHRHERLLPDWLDDALTDAIGPHWYDKNEQQWQRMYKLLCAYVAVHGHANVPIRHTTDEGETLGTWVRNLRSAQAGTAAYNMTPEHAALLEALPG